MSAIIWTLIIPALLIDNPLWLLFALIGILSATIGILFLGQLIIYRATNKKIKQLKSK